MVLSIALILAFAGAAIGFILAFVIFSEISETIELQVLKDFPQGCCPTPIPPDAQFGNSATGQAIGISNGIYGLSGHSGLTAGEEITKLRTEITFHNNPPPQTRLIVYNSTNNLIGASIIQPAFVGFPEYTFVTNPIVPSDGFVYIVGHRQEFGEAMSWRLGTGSGGFPLVRHFVQPVDFLNPSPILFNNGTISSVSHFFTEIFVSQASFQQPFTDLDVERAQSIQFAKSTGFTVLAILPISLFFIIFTVVGSFTSRT